MRVKRIVSKNELQENTYLVFKDGKGFIIDPGCSVEEISEMIEREKVEILAILLTHGHGDHIASVLELKEKYSVPIVLHEDEVEMVENVELNLSKDLLGKTVEFTPDITVKDEEELDFEGIEVKYIHTPGHTAGGSCILIEDHLFTGDTLFRESAGRTDLHGGSMRCILRSLRKLTEKLDPETIVLPGHGPRSTIGHEKENNSFITRFVGREL